MSQDLVKINTNNALAKPTSSWGDESDQQQQRVVYPRYIQIKNPKSKKQFANGHFFFSGSKDGEIPGKDMGSEIEMVILKIIKGRVKKTPYAPGKTSTLLCRSNDRKTPVTTDDRFEPLADDCTSCPYGKLAWANYNKKTKEGKPNNPCEETVGLLFLTPSEPNQPYIYLVDQFRPRLNMVEFDAVIRKISKDAEEQLGRRPDLFEFKVTMSTELQDDGNYLPVFPKIEDLTAEDIKTYGGLYEQFVTARRAALDAREDAAETATKHGEVEARLTGQQAQEPQEEVPAQPVQRPAVKTQYVPPASKRVVGTRPVYTPPVAAAGEGKVIEGKLDTPPVVLP